MIGSQVLFFHFIHDLPLSLGHLLESDGMFVNLFCNFIPLCAPSPNFNRLVNQGFRCGLCLPHCNVPLPIFRPSYGPDLSVRHKVFRKTGDMEDNSNAVRFKKHFFTVLLGGIGGKMAIKNNASTGTPKAIGQKRRKTRENKALSTQISQLGLQLAQNYF
mgnify:CR=1 FL=1